MPLNTTTAHVVNLSLTKYIKSRISLTGSHIALFWINKTQSQINQWVRNRVIEINRLTKKENWFYIDNSNMTADIGTRKEAKVADVLENSTWLNGDNWEKHDKAQFPTKSFHDIRLSQKELRDIMTKL